MQCELCGKEAKLVKTEIEGTVLDLCPSCSELGTVLDMPKKYANFRSNSSKGIERELVENYGSIIKTARENKNLSLEDFANNIREKESVLRRVEHGQLVPYQRLAKKIERALNISLYSKIPPNIQTIQRKNKPDITIGDVVKIKVKDSESAE